MTFWNGLRSCATYGAPSRLVDFMYSFYGAAYFARPMSVSGRAWAPPPDRWWHATKRFP